MVLVRVLIGCEFVRVVIESEICRIYKVILWTIKSVIRNLLWVSNFIS
jgi:hypothetical protein